MLKSTRPCFTYIVKNSSAPGDNSLLSTDEHFMNATELAGFMDIYYVSGKGVNSKLAKIIAGKIFPEYPQYFYRRRNGTDMRVYSKDDAFSIIKHILCNACVTGTSVQSIEFEIEGCCCMTPADSATGKLLLYITEKKGDDDHGRQN